MAWSLRIDPSYEYGAEEIERAPEQELYLAVIVQAFNDLRAMGRDEPSICRDARFFLLADTYTFPTISAAAGADPEKIRSIARRFDAHLRAGGVKTFVTVE